MSPPAASSKRPRTSFFVSVALVVVVLVLASLSFTYPFGHDQALYGYVAREWVHRGSVPYRDVFDHKTPGIYVIYALATVLFGDNMWGIRVCDLACVLAVAWLGARIALLASTDAKETDAPPGYYGVVAFLTYVIHYGFFAYWDTAQSELWYATFGLASIYWVLRPTRSTTSLAIAGVFGGVAFVIKPPAVWFCMVAFVLAEAIEAGPPAGRVRRMVRAGGSYTAGFILPCVLTILVLVATGAWSAFIDIVVGANGYYVSHEKEIHSASDLYEHIRQVVVATFPFMTTLVVGVVIGALVAVRRKDRSRLRRYAIVTAITLAGFLAMAMQQKFYWLHWMSMVGGAVVLASSFVLDVTALLGRSGRTKLAPLAAIVPLLAAYAFTMNASSTWLRESTFAWHWVKGDMSAEEHANHFRVDYMYFFYDDSFRAAEWIDAHSEPSDEIVVRGFHPEVYILANRHYGARFFWTLFLDDPGRAYRRADYLAEDAAALRARPPRFAVTLDVPGGIDSPTYFEELGYTRKATFGHYVVLEH